MKMLSFNNDPKLKIDMVSEMKLHQKQDDFIKGTYAKMNGRFKGCAVGCSIQSLNVKRGLSIKHDDHAGLAAAMGIPEWLFRLQDTLFENLPENGSKKFSLSFFKAIPVGVDIEPVKWKFCAFILKENIERVLLLKIDDKLKEQVVSAIKGVLTLHEQAAITGRWDESAAWSAAESAESASSAAWSVASSVAWSAAESARSAAWSVASSVAWSAAESAESARSATYSCYAKELLRLLKLEKK